jgi:hypothetical protein
MNSGRCENYPVRPTSFNAPVATIAFGCSDGTGKQEPHEVLPPEAVGSTLPASENVLRIGNHGYVIDPPFLPVGARWEVEGFGAVFIGRIVMRCGAGAGWDLSWTAIKQFTKRTARSLMKRLP